MKTTAQALLEIDEGRIEGMGLCMFLIRVSDSSDVTFWQLVAWLSG